jgi:hypothetical protein
MNTFVHFKKINEWEKVIKKQRREKFSKVRLENPDPRIRTNPKRKARNFFCLVFLLTPG